MKTKAILSELGLTASEIEVYVAMVEGKTQVKDIINITGMKRPSVYYAINKLETRGLIGRVQAGEYNQWQLSDPARLKQLVAEKVTAVTALEDSVAELAENIDTGASGALGTQVTFYKGQKAVEGVVFNALYAKGKEILSIAPDNNFFHQTGQEFATRFVAERQKRKLSTRHLWESQGPVPAENLKKYYSENADIRILPKPMREAFASTVFIYDDTVMYISSKRSAYAVVFKSKEHAELQRAIFETLWQGSSPIRT